jgi:anti-sigma factor RsiW
MSSHLSDDRLLAYAMGRLDAEAAAAVETHARACAECARRLAETEAVCAALPVTEVEPRIGFDTRMKARLDAIDAAAAASPWRWAWSLWPAAAVAAGLALVLSRPPDPSSAAPGLGAEPALLADLELLEELDAVELLDVVDDLDAIEALPEEEG